MQVNILTSYLQHLEYPVTFEKQLKSVTCYFSPKQQSVGN